MTQIPKTVVFGFGAGAMLGGALFLLSFVTAFGICSDTTIAEKLFPFALMVDPSLFQRPLLALVVSVVQYPLYGIVVGFAWRNTRLRIGSFVLLLVIHIAASTVASQRVRSMWQQRFSEMNS